MNDSSHSSQTPDPAAQPAESSASAQAEGTHANPHSHCDTGGCTFDPIARALRQGMDDAKKAAQDAVPMVTSMLSKAACQMAYGVSFAAAFQVALLREACPDKIKAAVIDGFVQGATRGATWIKHWEQKRSTPAAESAGPAGPMQDMPSLV